MSAKIGILTVSDRASRGVYEDRGGPAIHEYLSEVLTNDWQPFALVVPDEFDKITGALIRMVDDEGCSLVVTTGGTGPAVRDITPDATEAVCEKMMPGFGELMRQVSLQFVPTAILSRQTAGIRGHGFDRQPAGQAERHPRLPGRGDAGDSLLRGFDRGRLSDDRREQDRRLPAEGEIADDNAKADILARRA